MYSNMYASQLSTRPETGVLAGAFQQVIVRFFANFPAKNTVLAFVGSPLIQLVLASEIEIEIKRPRREVFTRER